MHLRTLSQQYWRTWVRPLPCIHKGYCALTDALDWMIKKAGLMIKKDKERAQMQAVDTAEIFRVDYTVKLAGYRAV